MPTQALTYICKIKNHDQVADALDQMGLACSKLWNVALYHTRQVWEEKGTIPSAYDTQKAVQDHFWYKQLPGHTAQAVTQELWQAYKSWFGHRRNGNPQARPPGYRKRNGKVPLSTVTVKRYGFGLESATLRLLRGRAVASKTGERYLYLELALPPGAETANPRLMRLVPRNGEWEVHLVCEVPVVEASPGDGVAAIDVGITNLAAVVYSDGSTELYSGRGLLAQEYYFAKEIARCKPAGWRPGSRKRTASERERRLHQKRTQSRRQFLHAVTRHIVDTCVEKGVGIIVLGDLKGIRRQANGEARSHGKAGNLKLHTWPFDTFAQMLGYKAKLAGITTVQVSERHTSQTCSVCGGLAANSRVHRGLYVCAECGATVNADINGAINILHKYLHGLDKSTGVPVRVGSSLLPTIWPEPSVNRYDWGKPNPLACAERSRSVRVAGSALAV
jgi:putative transposase